MKILIISYGYPPRAHVSAMRAHAMGRELVALGHDVSVLTRIWERPFPPYIASPEETVKRCMATDTKPRVFAADLRWVNPSFSDAQELEEISMSLAQKIIHLAQRIKYGTFYDWFRAAQKMLSEILKVWRPDVVWAVSESNSPHMLAEHISRNYGIPWVADFKDPWDFGFKSPIFKKIVYHQWRRIIATAQAITETSSRQAEIDADSFEPPIYTVYTGYDADLMAAIEPWRPTENCFYISYTGSAHSGQAWSLLFAGLNQFLNKSEKYAESTRLLHIGIASGYLAKLAVDAGVEKNFKHVGHQTLAKVLAYQQGCHLLLHLPNGFASMSKKFLEYLASGTPVLCIPPEQECSEIGRFFPQYAAAATPAEIASCLEHLWLSWNQGRLLRQASNDLISKYSYVSQCKLLEHILTDAKNGQAAAIPAEVKHRLSAYGLGKTFLRKHQTDKSKLT